MLHSEDCRTGLARSAGRAYAHNNGTTGRPPTAQLDLRSRRPRGSEGDEETDLSLEMIGNIWDLFGKYWPDIWLIFGCRLGNAVQIFAGHHIIINRLLVQLYA